MFCLQVELGLCYGQDPVEKSLTKSRLLQTYSLMNLNSLEKHSKSIHILSSVSVNACKSIIRNQQSFYLHGLLFFGGDVSDFV